MGADLDANLRVCVVLIRTSGRFSALTTPINDDALIRLLFRNAKSIENCVARDLRTRSIGFWGAQVSETLDQAILALDGSWLVRILQHFQKDHIVSIPVQPFASSLSSAMASITCSSACGRIAPSHTAISSRCASMACVISQLRPKVSIQSCALSHMHASAPRWQQRTHVELPVLSLRMV